MNKKISILFFVTFFLGVLAFIINYGVERGKFVFIGRYLIMLPLLFFSYLIGITQSINIIKTKRKRVVDFVVILITSIVTVILLVFVIKLLLIQ